MKTILFTHFYEKLMNRTKQQTIRLLMIPTYIITEYMGLRFRFEDKTEKFLFVVYVTELFPLQIKQIDEEIAVKDGFDCVEDCIHGLATIHSGIYRKTNSLKPNFKERWAFVTRWEDLPKEKTLEAYF